MNSLVFKKGFKNWTKSYKVEINFEYTADLEKKLTDLKLEMIDCGRSICVPWTIFKVYMRGGCEHSYADPSGLKIVPVDDGVVVSDSRFFDLQIHGDQMEAIKKVANNVSEDISDSIEKILRGFTPTDFSV